MVAQLDPGFTTQGFWANAAIAVLGSFVGTVGAFVVAWMIYRRTSREERSRFEAILTSDRQIFQDTVAHDLAVRRREDERRAQERDAESREIYKRTIISLMGELNYNVEAFEAMKSTGFGYLFPLRVAAFEQAYPSLGFLPVSIGQHVQLALFHIDRYNAALTRVDSATQIGALLQSEVPLNEAATVLAGHIREMGWMPADDSDEETTNKQAGPIS
jgi:hypothetical protein